MTSGPGSGLPDIGAHLKRLRRQRGLSLKQVAQESGLSPSFLSAVERGESDIALQRLARLARVFHHDVGSLLGYSARQAQPQLVARGDRFKVDRGEGIDYEAIRIPGTGFELLIVSFAPRAAFRDAITHAGVDIVYVAEGEVVLVYDGVDYPMRTGDCGVWPGAYPHAFRNDADEPARLISVVTETLY